MRGNDWFTLIASIAITEGVGFLGSVVTTPAISTWYAGLIKSSLTPPPWVFGPVWTLLYLLMGISLFLIWRHGYRKKRPRHAIWVFAVQLVLNFLWSVFFFGMHNPAAAFAEIILLWGMVLVTIVVFKHLSHRAAWLLVPYLIWITFAGYLNYVILISN